MTDCMDEMERYRNGNVLPDVDFTIIAALQLGSKALEVVQVDTDTDFEQKPLRSAENCPDDNSVASIDLSLELRSSNGSQGNQAASERLVWRGNRKRW